MSQYVFMCTFSLHRWLTALGLGAYIDNFHELGLISMHHLDDFSLEVGRKILPLYFIDSEWSLHDGILSAPRS